MLSHSFADVSLLIGYKLQMNIGRELGSMALSGHKRRALIAVSSLIGQLHARFSNP
jgi:hypothetical protein